MNCLINLAGETFQLESTYRQIELFCHDFIVETGEPCHILCWSNEDLEKEWKRLTSFKNVEHSIQRRSVNPVLERRAALRKVIEFFPNRAVMMMHGVVISDGKKAIMITAPSGEGKTTRAHILIDNRPDLFILNGDKPFLKIMDNYVLVYDSPWRGKENEGVNTHAILKNIFLLERADYTEITETSVNQSFDFLVSQTCMPERYDNILRTIELIRALEGKVGIYRFKSEPSLASISKAWNMSTL